MSQPEDNFAQCNERVSGWHTIEVYIYMVHNSSAKSPSSEF
jgi:hypothetical protein